ncbi:Spectrin beta chain, brain 1 [Chelonia mydas]|uniref:Spectrin beta chain, brain 1 n=1 Tax=Chelonia mydas TaxID=8469 RepID=M7AVU5_CHEMY|nr:Spectrin beta chain, brain 1 [Chelonia mydas]
MTTTVATDYDNIEIQQQYSDVNNRWDVDDWDNENSSARLFERSRIKALAEKWSALLSFAVKNGFSSKMIKQLWLLQPFEYRYSEIHH